MLRRLDALKEDHARLRQLLCQCEVAAPEELRAALTRLQEALGSHLKAKENLYELALLATRAAGDMSGLPLLNIFRTNLQVTSSAVLGFLRTPEPDAARLQQRLRAVIGALRALLDTEEKVIFPLCTRHAAALVSSGWGGGPSASEPNRLGGATK